MDYRTNRLDIDLPRNGQFARMITVTDGDGDPINITGATFDADAASHPGQAAIASATCTIDSGPAGTFNMVWDGSDFASFGSLAETSIAVYDVRMVLAGVPWILFRGAISLLPGISNG